MDERLHLCVDVEERQPWRGGHRAEGSQVELALLPTGSESQRKEEQRWFHVSVFADGCLSAAAPKNRPGPFFRGTTG